MNAERKRILIEICFGRRDDLPRETDAPDAYRTRTAITGALAGAAGGSLIGAIVRDAIDEAKKLEHKKRTFGRLGIPALIGAGVGSAGLGALGYYNDLKRDKALRDYRKQTARQRD